MKQRIRYSSNNPFLIGLFWIFMTVLTASQALCSIPILPKTEPNFSPEPFTEFILKDIPYKIVYESLRQTQGRENWELILMNADGSEQTQITDTPYLDEMYPHVSPDGTKICFVIDRGMGRNKTRAVCYMNIDGTGRVKVADNARQPCWSPDGKIIAYLKGEFERYTRREYATTNLILYDVKTRSQTRHPIRELHHLYALCWSPDRNWFVGVVHGGMGYSDTILAFEANGTKVYDLAKWSVKGCRPDLSIDGTRMVWGETDWNLKTGIIDLNGTEPKVTDIREIVRCTEDLKLYHIDLSPDSRYIAFTHGSVDGDQAVGGRAEGWNICVGDLNGHWIQITTDGLHNKEPDWVPLPRSLPGY
ncbi:MAG: PD40 domain-containing protein [Sedimentisphaerales bacterium]|nr:PD40 domain-containing protein [Sedimentisphaerales bacterium]